MGGRRCFVAGCTEYKKKNTSFHRFPTDSEVAKQWSLILKELNNQKNSFECDVNSTICGWHFAPHYKITIGAKCCLKITAIPTIFGNYNEEQPFLTYKKEYACERCGHCNTVMTSLKGSLFGGSQLITPTQESKMALDSAQNQKNDPLACASSQFSSANHKNNLGVHPEFYSELSNGGEIPEKRKRIRYPGDVKDGEELGEQSSQQFICVLKKKIAAQRKQTNNLAQRNRRYEKKISTLKNLLKELMEKTMSKQHANES